LVYVNNLLMLSDVSLLAILMIKGRMNVRMRHPMLPAVRIWVIAHLLVNGDLGSILMFGTMLGWPVWS
jgi:uncharacterized membrane protein